MKTGSLVVSGNFDLKSLLSNDASRIRPWMLNLSFGIMTVALLAGAPGALRVIYPVAALLIGLYFYRRFPLGYISFALWLYFLTPFIRRLADYRIGTYVEGNTILLAPPLVSLIALLTLTKLPRRIDDTWLAFIMLLGTILYGAVLGFTVLSNHGAVIKAFVGWIAPMAIAVHFYLNWKIYPEMKHTLYKLALGGLLVVGFYGVIQFVLAPPWDRLWMQAMEYDASSGPGVYGEPVPFAIRTFSTMNSHQPMAIVLIILAIIALTKRERLYTFAAGIGMLPVLFSLARTAWLQAIVSFFVLALLTRKVVYVKLLVAAILILGALGIGLSFTSFGDVLQQRILSFSDKGDDISVGARQAGYSKGLDLAEKHPLGMGVGGMEVAYTPVIYEDFGPNDSAIVEILVEFGVAGAIVMLLAMFIGLRQIYILFLKTKDPLLAGILAIWAGLLVQSPLNSSLDGAHGTFVWVSFAVGLACVRHTKDLKECEEVYGFLRPSFVS